MLFEIDGREAFAATGGRNHDPELPLAIFLHGAGMDHSVWALQSAGSPITAIACLRWTCPATVARRAHRSRASPRRPIGPPD
jgi:hypothetical protein